MTLDADRGPPVGNRRLLGHTRQRYWNDAGTAPLEYWDCESRALPYETYALALTAHMLPQDGPLDGNVATSVAREQGFYKLPSDINEEGFEAEPPSEHAEDTIASDGLWASTGHPTFDAASFFHVTRVTDVFGTSTDVTYDAEELFVTATTLDLASPLNLSTTAEIDVSPDVSMGGLG